MKTSTDQMIQELKAAGWIPITTPIIWASPSGRLYLGPYGAWKELQAGLPGEIPGVTPDPGKRA
jgi:hypothetical protein